MNAIIQSGGKQLKVKAGDIVEVEKLAVADGAEVIFDQVLAVEGDDGKLNIGTPVVAGAKVVGKVLEVIKARKVVAFKMKRRKGYRRTHGHRQQYSRVEITAVNA
ncbi:MAG: 50S ribosomal protein L21 [Lentisphaeria bacterium]|nr:50S ribosomal protein L21 [Lentisphaeria bacterium]